MSAIFLSLNVLTIKCNPFRYLDQDGDNVLLVVDNDTEHTLLVIEGNKIRNCIFVENYIM